MYEFKHKINDNQRFNSYEIMIQEDENQSTPYQTLRNSLFFIILLLTLFIVGAFAQKSYQNYKKRVGLKPIVIKEIDKRESTNVNLTKIITNSVINNLRANNQIKTVNYSELKLIIQRVVKKIEDKTQAKKTEIQIKER